MSRVKLLPNEKVRGEFRPRLMSFLGGFLPYVYLIGLGVISMAYQKEIATLSEYFWIFGPLVKPYLTLILFLILLILPAIVLGLIHISMRTVLIFVSIAIVTAYVYVSASPEIYRDVLLLSLGISGIFLTEIHRRSHRYYVTNYRLMLERTFPTRDRREILLENIQDLAFQQGLLGRLFNYGNIIPTSAAGVGTGEDQAAIHLAASAKVPKSPLSLGAIVSGGKGVIGFRARPHNCLFGVADPEELSNLIIRLKFERSEATKLEEIKQLLSGEKPKNDTSPSRNSLKS